jgi:hypothetical protein
MNLIIPADIIFKKRFIARCEKKQGNSQLSLLKKNIRFRSMFIHSAHHSKSTGMKRSHFLICLAIMLLMVPVSADSLTTTTTTPGMTGGSVYFDTNPPGATILLDNVELGTSPFTYYFEKPGTFDVIVRKKWYEDYTDKVVVIEGQRVVFSARLTPVPSDLTAETTPAAPVTTATTISTSTIKIPTPWPTSSPASPPDPAVVIGAVAAGIGFFVIRLR